MQSYYEIITPAAGEPLSVASARSFLRVETTADDALIGTMISAARDIAEKLTGRLFAAQTLRVSFPCFEFEGAFNRIQKAPLVSLDTVETWDGTAYVAFAEYFLKPTNGFPEIHYTSTPTAFTNYPFIIRAQFQAGYSTLPPDLTLALLQHVAFFYENRGDVQAVGGLKMPKESELVYRKYRILSTYG